MNDLAIGGGQTFTTLVVIILCGLVGSGKSTFANALQREFPEFRRCNQDELGRRGDVERAVHSALSRGMSVCVDRTNIDPGQRHTWVEIAHQYKDAEVWGVTMDTPYEVCRERLVERTEHPTLKSVEQALHVLSRFSNEFVPIDASEGFNRVYRLPPHNSPDFTREELEDILTAIRSTPFYDASLPPAPAPTNSSRSRGFYPNRGRGRGWNTEPSQSHGWRTSPSTAGPHTWGANPTRGTWVPSQDQGSWRSQDTGGRGSSGDNRRPYRGGYSRGRGGWNHAPFANQSPSRGGPGSSRGRGSYPPGRGGLLGAPQAQYEAVSTSDGNLRTTDMTGSSSLYPTGADTESSL